ncbi:MAG: phosphate ABC transporter substrate-binding protein PstS [Fibrobacteria bacterium]
MMKIRFSLAAFLLIPSALSFALDLNGAGSTFIYPLASKWFSEYNKKTGIKINYQSIGSGAGIRQLLTGTVDFGASDATMSDEDMKKGKYPILHLPATMGAVAIVYNLPDAPTGIKMTPDILAGIFLGDIKKWDDKAIMALNPGMKIPGQDISVAHRSDGSGTTSIFTEYLSKVSPKWLEKVGKGTAVNWPVGLGGKGNEAVAGLVKQVAGSIGYVELAYALENKLSFALIRNQSGQYPLPSIETTTAAAASAIETMPADFRASITNMPGKDSYPICGFTWILAFKKYDDAAKAKTLVDFLTWSMDEGQKMGPALHYSPLPPSLIQKIKVAIATINENDPKTGVQASKGD